MPPTSCLQHPTSLLTFLLPPSSSPCGHVSCPLYPAPCSFISRVNPDGTRSFATPACQRRPPRRTAIGQTADDQQQHRACALSCYAG
eukprot:3421689-Pyramimonas_sp.AAC.1